MDEAPRYLTEAKKKIIAARQRFCCNICKEMLSDIWHADHIDPFHLSGSNSFNNYQILCANCHGKKTQLEMIRYHERRKELRTGKSHYFDPASIDFINGYKYKVKTQQNQG